MGLFKWLKKKETQEQKSSEVQVYACCKGNLIDIETVDDPVFAKKEIGDGIAILPDDGKIVAPCDGMIILVADTLHTFGIQACNGLELLVHIGIGTIHRKGEGFTQHAREEQFVKKGDVIISFDYDQFVKEKVDMTTTMILTNQLEYEISNLKQTGFCNVDTLVFSSRKKELMNKKH